MLSDLRFRYEVMAGVSSRQLVLSGDEWVYDFDREFIHSYRDEIAQHLVKVKQVYADNPHFFNGGIFGVLKVSQEGLLLFKSDYITYLALLGLKRDFISRGEDIPNIPCMTIGLSVCAYVKSSDGYVIMVQRGEDILRPELSHLYQQSVVGAVDFSSLREYDRMVEVDLRNAVLQELEEELGIKECHVRTCRPLAYVYDDETYDYKVSYTIKVDLTKDEILQLEDIDEREVENRVPIKYIDLHKFIKNNNCTSTVIKTLQYL